MSLTLWEEYCSARAPLDSLLRPTRANNVVYNGPAKSAFTLGASRGTGTCRVVAGGEGGRVRTRNAHPVRAAFERVAANASRFPAFDPVREARVRTESAFSRRRLIATFRSLRPRVAARSPMGGALWPATVADGCRAHALPLGVPSHVGCQIIDWRARPWSRRSPRAFRCGTFGGLELERIAPIAPGC